MQATKDNARMVAAALAPMVNAVLLARAAAQVEHERMRALDTELLDYLDVRYSMGRALGAERAGQRIKDPKDLWRMGDEYAPAYWAERDKRLREMGYTTLKPGECPALVLDEVVRKAEHLLIAEAAGFFPTVSVNSLLCLGLEKYRRFIDLCIGLVVNSPGYVPPAVAQ